MEWYPSDKKELNKILDYLLSLGKESKREIHGLIVPHAGYAYSGEIAGKTYSILKNSKIKKAIVFGPSHYVAFKGIATLEKIETPLGEIKISKNFYQKLKYEHSVENQIPFLQKLGVGKILPIIVGQISEKEASDLAKQFSHEEALFVFSTDLSHFLKYEEAVKKDKETIKIIEELDFKKTNKIDACGIFPLMIAMNLCKLKKWRPELVEYKNSGDITCEKDSVVGYCGMSF